MPLVGPLDLINYIIFCKEYTRVNCENLNMSDKPEDGLDEDTDEGIDTEDDNCNCVEVTLVKNYTQKALYMCSTLFKNKSIL